MADDPDAARRRASRRNRDPGGGGDPAPSDAAAEDSAADAASPPSPIESTDGDASVPATDDEPGLESASVVVEDDTTPDATPEPVEAAAEGEPDSGIEPPTTEDQSAADAAADAVEPVETAADPGDDQGALDVAEPAAAAEAATLWESPDGTPTASLPWLQARSPDDRICPFLRAVAADDHLGFPVESPDAANRCASMHEAVPQSLRQQELVCLTSNHVNCPRYLRGAAETATVVPVARVRPKAVMTPAISAALIILALSFGASVVFGLANGGLAMPSRAAVATPRASATSVAAEATASPASSSPPPSSATASPSLGPTSAPSATPIPSPSATPIPSASASASAATGPTPTPTSSRYRLLKPCPNKPNCWIYTVRAGDNLFSIAKYFGVPLSTVHRLNPWTRTESLRAGKKLILPPPTR